MKNQFELKIKKSWFNAIVEWNEKDYYSWMKASYSPNHVHSIIDKEHIRCITQGDLCMKFSYSHLQLVYNSILMVVNSGYSTSNETIKIWCTIRDLLFQLLEEAPVYKGFHVSVYRNASGYDCTNNGISSRFNTILLVGEDVPAIFSEKDPEKVIFIKKTEYSGNCYLFFQPLIYDDRHTMFGGNFAYTSDSRFRNLFANPVPIHDRIE